MVAAAPDRDGAHVAARGATRSERQRVAPAAVAAAAPLRYTARSAGLETQIDGGESDFVMTGWSEREDGGGHGMTTANEAGPRSWSAEIGRPGPRRAAASDCLDGRIGFGHAR